MGRWLEYTYVFLATLITITAVSFFVVDQQNEKHLTDYGITQQKALSVYTDIINFVRDSDVNTRQTISIEENTRIANNQFITTDPETGDQRSVQMDLFIQGTSCVGENEVVKLTEGIAICCGECDADVQLDFPSDVMCSSRQDEWMACNRFARPNVQRIAVKCAAIDSQLRLQDDQETIIGQSFAHAQWGEYLVYRQPAQLILGRDYMVQYCENLQSTLRYMPASVGGGGGGGGPSRLNNPPSQSQNNAPSVLLSLLPLNGTIPFSVHAQANATDSDGSITQYLWTLTNGSIFGGSNLTEVYQEYTTPGAKITVVNVTDDDGAVTFVEGTILAFAPSATCGDNTTQGSEVCDGNIQLCTSNGYLGSQYCLPNCSGFNTTCLTPLYCGDNVVNGNEQCDDGQNNGQPGYCDESCTGTTAPICGNSVVESGEQCDDGNMINNDVCYLCQRTTCGDGIIQSPNGLSQNEVCDAGANNGLPNYCNVACSGMTSATCGNNVTESGEACDDGNILNTDACTATCTVAICGDGFVRIGFEECDEGALGSLTCTSSCHFTACGDNVVQSPNGQGVVEVCDGSSQACTTNSGYSGNRSCLASCLAYGVCTTTQRCGDGTVNGLEYCDAGVNNGLPNHCNDLCTGTTPAVCGNGVIETGESCDDTNTNDGDGCSSSCQPTVACWDGFDNDADGEVDFPADFGCVSQIDNNEDAAPVVVLVANPTAGNAPLTVLFNISSSYDYEPGILTVYWDYNNDGSVDDSASFANDELLPIVNHTYQAGIYNASVTIIDEGMQSGVGFTQINVTAVEASACSDGLDNDGDAQIDDNDSGCTSAQDDDEDASPLAFIAASSTQGYVPFTVNFDPGLSRDDEGLITSYAWDYETDGIVDQTYNSPVIASHLYTEQGTFIATLTVVDSSGKNATFSVQIIVQLAQASTQCNDGTDNDGDGLVDWIYDLGCFGPSDTTEGGPLGLSQDNGWTVVEPSPDTRIIYVSDSLGSDAYTGLCPEPAANNCGPKKTIWGGESLLRWRGYEDEFGNRHWNAKYPDWLLLRRGDTFFNQSISPIAHDLPPWSAGGYLNVDGRSGSERFVISSYGPSTARPKVYTPNGTNAYLSVDQVNLLISGIEFNNHLSNPNSPHFATVQGTANGALTFMYNVKNVTVEDCLITSYPGAIMLQGSDGYDELSDFFKTNNVVIRRNVIYNSFSGGGHSNAIFTHDGGNITLEDNFMYMNGWTDTFDLVAPTGTGYDQVSAWNGITNGDFTIELDDTDYQIAAVDLSSATTMYDVAQIFETKINAAIGGIGHVDVRWMPMRGQFLFNTSLPHNDLYSISANSGPGTDLVRPINANAFIKTSGEGGGAFSPGKTYFNRDMYISTNFGNTIARGNIVAEGASGGIQLRMCGVMEDNLALRQPLALTCGHDQNPDINLTPVPVYNGQGQIIGYTPGDYGQGEAQIPFGGIIRNNVVLDAEDIDERGQPRGTGIGVGGIGVEAYGNIVSSNVRGKDVYAFGFGGSAVSPLGNALIYNNIVYNWFASSAGSTNAAFYISSGNSNPYNKTLARNISFFNNTIYQQQGRIFYTWRTVAAWRNPLNQWDYEPSYLFDQFRIYNNTYYGGAAANTLFRIDEYNQVLPGRIITTNPAGSMAFGGWQTYTNDNSMIADPNFADPDRSIESYMLSLGLTPTYDAFIAHMLNQSRLTWDDRFTAYAVNDYIREGFATN